MKEKLPTICEGCGSPLVINRFRVAVTTPNPKVVEIRMVNVAVCKKCSMAYWLRDEIESIFDRLIAWEIGLEEIFD